VSQEIVYTSAQKGLKAGSRGFCTVVSTFGMAQNLAERLESLSGYRHQFNPHDEGENPVNHSHLLVTVGGQKYHVLSRVCDAGLDYTQRTNKLAHHVAFTPREVQKMPGGPAWVLSTQDFLVSKWDGQVKTVPESNTKTVSTRCGSAICETWRNVTGDAGWAGRLADAAMNNEASISVIFASGTATLELVREAMALLPEDQRWFVTFSTYYTKLPAGVDCQWRFILHGTQDADLLRRNPHSRVVDLCNTSLGLAPNSDMVFLARTGQLPERTQQPAVTEQYANRRAGNTSSAERRGPPQRVLADKLAQHSPQAFPVTSVTYPRQNTQGKMVSVGVLVLTGLFTLLFFTGLVGAYFAGRASAWPMSSTELAANRIAEVPETNLESKKNGPVTESRDLVAPTRTEESEGENADRTLNEPDALDAANINAAGSLKDIPPDAVSAKDAPNPQPRQSPFEDIIQRKRLLRLPFKETKSMKDFVELAKLYVEDVTQCKLTLTGGIEIKPQVEGTPAQWLVISKNAASGLSRCEGRFQLVGDSLQFKWERGELKVCDYLLEITVGKEKETCILAFPVVEPQPVRPELKLPDEKHSFKLPSGESGKYLFDAHITGGERVLVDNCSFKEKPLGIPINFSVSRTASDIAQEPVQIELTINRSPELLTIALSATASKMTQIFENVQIEQAERDVAVGKSPFRSDQETISFNSRDIRVRESELGNSSQTILKLKENWTKQKAADNKARHNICENAKRALAIAERALLLCEKQVEMANQILVEKEMQKRGKEETEAAKQDLAQKRKHLDEVVQKTRDDARQAVEQATKELEVPKHRDEVYRQLDVILKEERQWIKSRHEFLTQLQNELRIHFRVYEIKDGLTVLQTAGWESLELDRESGERR
jgi:GTPase-associated protein 1, N-terminal domain type 2/GTPase-associated protein 1, middle domain